MIYKIALLAYLFLYNGIALFIRSYILYQKTGINPFQKMGGKDLKGFNERILILGATLVPLIAILFVFFEKTIYPFLVPIEYLEIEGLRQLGIVFMLLGSIFAIIAQFQMGDSWRIGINHQEKTEIVKTGFFKYSRNPIYLGLLISFFGFFLIAPNALSLCCLVLSYPSVEIKIRLEEQYLLEKHQQAFSNYMAQVNRWL